MECGWSADVKNCNAIAAPGLSTCSEISGHQDSNCEFQILE